MAKTTTKMTTLQRRTISHQYRQTIEELQEQVRRLRERVHDLETLIEGEQRRHTAEVRRLNEQASLEEARQLIRETELLAQRRQAIELLARIEKGAV
jgi:predicted  nucleic acid-binding Zn-ribbon protein